MKKERLICVEIKLWGYSKLSSSYRLKLPTLINRESKTRVGGHRTFRSQTMIGGYLIFLIERYSARGSDSRLHNPERIWNLTPHTATVVFRRGVRVLSRTRSIPSYPRKWKIYGRFSGFKKLSERKSRYSFKCFGALPIKIVTPQSIERSFGDIVAIKSLICPVTEDLKREKSDANATFLGDEIAVLSPTTRQRKGSGDSRTAL